MTPAGVAMLGGFPVLLWQANPQDLLALLPSSTKSLLENLGGLLLGCDVGWVGLDGV